MMNEGITNNYKSSEWLKKIEISYGKINQK